MLRLALTLAAAVLALVAAPAGAAPRVVAVDVPTAADRDLLTTLDLDLTEHGGPTRIDVVLHDAADAERLREAGLSYRDLPRRTIRRQAPPGPPPALPSGRTAYRRLADYAADLRRLAAEHPRTVRLVTAPGASLEGRAIEGVEVARDVHADDGRPVLLVLGLHHAREWPSGELSLEFAFELAARSGDPHIGRLLQRARVVVLPVVNPDGFTVSREAEGADFALKRRNCRLVALAVPAAEECGHAAHRDAGVDLNRNYDGFWGGAGSSADPRSDVYHGSAPFSEPETRAVRDFVRSRQVVTLLSNHTYGALVLRPPGEAGGPRPADEPAYRRLGDAMARASGYASRRAWELYETTGTTEDWSHFATGGLAYTIEIGRGEGSAPFHPPFAGGVVEEWPWLRDAFLVALESTADRSLHGVVTGRAPAGTRLALRTAGGDPLATSMTVDAGGRFAYHVNPSTRPLAARAGRTEAWRLTCVAASGKRIGGRDVVVERGDVVDVPAACRSRRALRVAVKTSAPARGRAPRGRALEVRVSCSRACTASARLHRGGRTLARSGRRTGGLLRLHAGRRAGTGDARLVVRARARGGDRVTVRRRVHRG